jgi:CRISPR-associated protein Csb1
MANRLESTIWDEAGQKPVVEAEGISYIRVERNGQFLTSSILEAHRINSPYLLEGADKTFFDELKNSLGGLAEGPVNRKLLAETLFKYDVNTLIHGVFLAKKDLAGGRLRIARALSAFVEADSVELAASGGVKNDHVFPSGDTAKGFGNVPFSRDEYTARNITLYVNIDLDQIRGYGLSKQAEDLLILLSVYKVRALLSGTLRFRTACDLSPAVDEITAAQPKGFKLPEQNEIGLALTKSIAANKADFLQTVVQYNDKFAKGKHEKSGDQQ